MRKVSRDGIVTPQELTSDECLAHRAIIIANPTTVADSNLYRGRVINADGSTTFAVRDALRNLYKRKCAYCEKFSHMPRVDHHRPKGRVVGTANGSHGYYWLAYEWSNLLPCCTDCNSIEAKGAHYPILGNRNSVPPVIGNPPMPNFINFVYSDPYNLQEDPLLLHPEYCEPELHFTFDIEGKIIGRTPQGLRTITVVKLDNSDLNGWRRSIYNDKIEQLRLLMVDYFSSPNSEIQNHVKTQINNWLIRLAVEAADVELEYTAFRKQLIDDFERFFIDPMDAVFQPILIDIFLEYLDNL